MPSETLRHEIKSNRLGEIKKNNSSFYSSSAWRKLAKLHKILYPICAVIDCNKPVHTSDHIVPINEGGARLDMSNLQSLCKYHNFQKTGRDGKKKGVNK